MFYKVLRNTTMFRSVVASFCLSVHLLSIEVNSGIAVRKSQERELLEFLLRRYDPDSRPVRKASDTIHVNVSVALMQIMDLAEKNQTLITQMTISQQWNDEYLQWYPEDFKGLEYLILPSRKIWLPDLYIFNNAMGGSDGLVTANRSEVFISSYGRVFWSVPLIIRSACAVDVRYFPFDNQRCSISIGSWLYEESQVDLRSADTALDMTSYIPNKEFDLLSVSYHRKPLTADEFDHTYYHHLPKFANYKHSRFPHLVLTVHIRRKPLYYFYTIVAPTLVLCIMMLFTFFLPCESGDKVGIGLTVFLSLYVLQLAIAENIPESNSLPLISLFLLLVMTLNSISLMVSTLVINVKKKGDRRPCPEVPSWLLSFCQYFLARITFTKQLKFIDFYAVCAEEERILRRHSCNQDDPGKVRQPGGEAENSLRKNSSNASLFLVNRGSLSAAAIKPSTTTPGEKTPTSRPDYLAIPSQPNAGRRVSSFASNTSKRFMANRNIRLKWYFVAEVIDKVLFLMFLIAMTVTIVMSLVIVPELHKWDKWQNP